MTLCGELQGVETERKEEKEDGREGSEDKWGRRVEGGEGEEIKVEWGK